MAGLFRADPDATTCPACATALPTAADSVVRTPRVMSLSTRDGAIEASCWMHICSCGLAIVSDGDGYAFKCSRCRLFGPRVGRSGRCLACDLGAAGIGHAVDLLDSLHESESTMGATRSLFLDGFLRGVVLGVPGLVVTDEERGIG